MRRRTLSMTVALTLLAGAWLAAEARGKTPTVLFDQGHGQKFRVEKRGDLDLSKLAGLFRAAGHAVKTSSGRLTDAALSDVDALVISGPFTALEPAEIDAVLRFVKAGGRLCLMLHVPQPVAALMGRLRVVHSNGVIQETDNLVGGEPRDFYVTKLGQHGLLRGVQRFAVRGGWALLSESKAGESIAATGQRAWVDLNRNGALDPHDARQSFSVAVAGALGKGSWIVFGDDAVFQNKFLEGGNLALAKNLAAGRSGGSRSSR